MLAGTQHGEAVVFRHLPGHGAQQQQQREEPPIIHPAMHGLGLEPKLFNARAHVANLLLDRVLVHYNQH